MNIGVSVLAEQVRVRFQRIAYFDLRYRAFTREGMVLARGIAQRDAEIVNPVERSGDGLARGQGDRRGDHASGRGSAAAWPAGASGATPAASATARLQPAALQRKRIVLGADALQIAGRRMAGGARFADVRLALLAAARDRIQKRIGRA